MSNRGQENDRAPSGGLRTIRLLVSEGRYDWSEKVQTQIEGGWFYPEDLERCIESGQVKKTSKDRVGNSVGEKLYTILGSDCAGCSFYTVGKIVKDEEGNLYFFVTAHASKRG